MAGIRSYWEELGVNDASQISSMSEGFVTFIKDSKTDWEVKDYLIRKLFNYRFLELQSISTPGAGTGFILDLGEENFAAGVFGKWDIMKRGISILACPVDAPLIEVGVRSPGMIQEYGISTVRLKTKNKIQVDQWLSMGVTLHGRMKADIGQGRSFVLGENSREPRYSLSQPAEDTRKPGHGNGTQLDLIIGTERSPESGKREYNRDFLTSLSMDEKSFNSSSLCLLPSFRPHELGSDRSMIRGYGAYERLSAYAALKTLTDITSPEDTFVVIFYSARSVSGKKAFLKELVSTTLEAVVKKMVAQITEKTVSEIFEQSRFMNVSQISSKKKSGSDKTLVKPLPVGKGPVLGTLSSTVKTGKSEVILELVIDKLYKGTSPFMKVPRNYEFDAGDFLGNTFHKSVYSMLCIGFPKIDLSESVISIISKVDLWSAYKAMLAYATY